MTGFTPDHLSSWSSQPLSWLLSQGAINHPHRDYLLSRSRRFSYRDADRLVSRLAQALCQRYGPGPTVVSSVFRDPESLLWTIWASLRSGVSLALLPTIRSQPHVRRLMQEVGSSVLLTDLEELSGEGLPLVSSEADAEIPLIFETLRVQPGGRARDGGSPAILIQTSGTTGEPKWVSLTHGQFLTALECLEAVGGIAHARNQVLCLTAPLFHAYGLSALLEYTLAGSSILLPRGVSPLGPLGGIPSGGAAEQITALEGAPLVYHQLARFTDRIRLPALRHIGFGGGPADLAAIQQIRRIWPELSYSIRYGLTETPSVVTQKVFSPPYRDDWTSCGRRLPIYDLQIVDSGGDVLARYQEGQIRVRGVCVAQPYFRECGPSGVWFPTGDMGYLDLNDELHVVGRKSYFLKNRGVRFSPEHVESVLREDERVLDCRVSMVKGTLTAELVSGEKGLSAQEVLRGIRVKLPDYAVPTRIVFVASVPRTASGKLVRF